MKVKITRLSDKAILPDYQTKHSAAMDMAACIDEPITLQPMERRVIPTGFAVAIPEGYEIQVRARSGLSLKHGITTANGIGTVDSDYRGEMGAIMINLSDTPFVIEPGMRIAQMLLAKCEKVELEEVDELDETERGANGYGSTGH